MNIAAAIAEEHSKAQALKIATYVLRAPVHFGELMYYFLGDDHRIAQRAAWSVCMVVQQKPELLRPFMSLMYGVLYRNEKHPAIIRNTLRVLQYVDVSTILNYNMLPVCFDYLATPETPVAIKAFALNLLSKLAVHYPEIIPEITLIIEDRLPIETPAFASSARRFLKQHNKLRHGNN